MPSEPIATRYNLTWIMCYVHNAFYSTNLVISRVRSRTISDIFYPGRKLVHIVKDVIANAVEPGSFVSVEMGVYPHPYHKPATVTML